MKPVIGFFTIFITIYTAAHIYTGRRLQQAFGQYLSKSASLYWVPLLILALLYPVGRFVKHFLPAVISQPIIIIGSYWLGFVYYLFILLFLYEIARLLNLLLNIAPAKYNHLSFGGGITILIITLIIVAAGAINARNPIIRSYQLSVPKAAGQLSSLRVVAVSDIHLGNIIGTNRLENLVQTINSLKPDIVLLPGDIIDEDVNYFAEQKMPEILRRLSSRFGTYAVLGNHEYIGGNTAAAIYHLAQSGITVLRDASVKVNNQFYIIGRDDLSSRRFTNGERKPLQSIMQDLDRSLPLILLDHQPANLIEADRQQIDVQFSGHTHRGQLFPNGLITRKMYEVDWGYLQKNHLQVIVSCGYGTWGPPLRIGNRPEIVLTTITFHPAK